MQRLTAAVLIAVVGGVLHVVGAGQPQPNRAGMFLLAAGVWLVATCVVISGFRRSDRVSR